MMTDRWKLRLVFHRPLFYPFVRSVSSCPARNKQCHWPLSSTDKHEQCQPTWSWSRCISPQPEWNAYLSHMWVEPVNLLTSVEVSWGWGTKSTLSQTRMCDKPTQIETLLRCVGKDKMMQTWTLIRAAVFGLFITSHYHPVSPWYSQNYH